MRGKNRSVRRFEYALSVGDLSAAVQAHEALDNDLTTDDVILAAELQEALRRAQEVEELHGCGALLDLTKSPVRYLVEVGRIDQERVQAAQRYSEHLRIKAGSVVM